LATTTYPEPAVFAAATGIYPAGRQGNFGLVVVVASPPGPERRGGAGRLGLPITRASSTSSGRKSDDAHGATNGHSDWVPMIARVPHRSGVTLIVSVSSVAGTRRDVEIGTMSCRRGDLVAKRKNNSNTVEDGQRAPRQHGRHRAVSGRSYWGSRRVRTVVSPSRLLADSSPGRDSHVPPASVTSAPASMWTPTRPPARGVRGTDLWKGGSIPVGSEVPGRPRRPLRGDRIMVPCDPTGSRVPAPAMTTDPPTST